MSKKHFSVVSKKDRSKPAIIEGNAIAVCAWLSKVPNLSALEVFYHETQDYVNADDFLNGHADRTSKSAKIESYVQKQISVKAVQITDKNIESVASWCGGQVRTSYSMSYNRAYIDLQVIRNGQPQRGLAFLDDWIVSDGTSFKIYRDQYFQSNFILKPEIEEKKREQILGMLSELTGLVERHGKSQQSVSVMIDRIMEIIS